MASPVEDKLALYANRVLGVKETPDRARRPTCQLLAKVDTKTATTEAVALYTDAGRSLTETGRADRDLRSP